MVNSQAEELIRIDDVCRRVGFSRSTIYSLMERDQFPRPVPLSATRRAWVASEVAIWIQQRIGARGTVGRS